MSDLLYKIENSFVSGGSVAIYYLGQSGYVFKTNAVTIYIDPYLSDFVEHPDGLSELGMARNFPPPVFPEKISQIDAVLCTHSHADHMDPWTINNIKKDFTLISSRSALKQSGLIKPDIKTRFIDINEKIDVGDVSIKAIPAAHYHLYDSRGNPDCVSFILTVGDNDYFFWGDGLIYDGLIENLSRYRFRYFFAPINGRDWFREKNDIIGNLSSLELAKLSPLLKVDKIIPNHYDMFESNTESTEIFLYYLSKYAPNQETTLMNAGDCLAG